MFPPTRTWRVSPGVTAAIPCTYAPEPPIPPLYPPPPAPHKCNETLCTPGGTTNCICSQGDVTVITLSMASRGVGTDVTVGVDERELLRVELLVRGLVEDTDGVPLRTCERSRPNVRTSKPGLPRVPRPGNQNGWLCAVRAGPSRLAMVEVSRPGAQEVPPSPLY